MSFAESDYLRVLKHLQLPIAQKGLIQSKLGEAEADSALQQIIKDTLTALDTLRATLTTERSNSNAALVKADVLEWEPGKRTAGMEREYFEQQLQLANLLGIVWLKGRSGSTTSTQIEVWHG